MFTLRLFVYRGAASLLKLFLPTLHRSTPWSRVSVQLTCVLKINAHISLSDFTFVPTFMVLGAYNKRWAAAVQPWVKGGQKTLYASKTNICSPGSHTETLAALSHFSYCYTDFKRVIVDFEGEFQFGLHSWASLILTNFLSRPSGRSRLSYTLQC